MLTARLGFRGYDGLCSEDCGCSRDDLAPCGCLNLRECRAAYRWRCKACPERETCPYYDEVGGMQYADETGCYRGRRQG